MALVSTVLLLHNQLFPDLSEQNCKAIFPVAAWTELIQIILAEIVITIRTWAVWHRHKIISVGLGALFVGSLIFTCVVTSRFLATAEYAPPPYPGFRGCFFSAAATKNLWPIYMCMTATSSIILTLMGISAFQSYRLGNNNELSYVIHRDGIMFYFYLLCLTATDMAVKFAAPPDMNYLMDPLLGALYPVFVSRIVFNIRQAGNRVSETEVHTRNQETALEFSVTVPLQVMSTSTPRHDRRSGLGAHVS